MMNLLATTPLDKFIEDYITARYTFPHPNPSPGGRRALHPSPAGESVARGAQPTEDEGSIVS